MEMQPRAATGNTNFVPAIPGELVFLAVHYVRAEKRVQFEQYIHRIHAAAEHLHTEADHHVRVLLSNQPNEDGSYTYVFLMDPLIEGSDLRIDSLLTRFYGTEKLSGNYMA